MNMDRIEALFKEFTEAAGVSGFEGEIFDLLGSHLADIAKIERDNLGSFIAKLENSKENPRVMLAAHMDEIGFMVSYFSDNFVKFNTIGGWWPVRMIGLPVLIKTLKGDVPGVVASKSPFHMDAKEREQVPKVKDLYIDVGLPKGRSPSTLGIQPGDAIVPDMPFKALKPKGTYMAKAWDDRIGCVMLVEVLRRLSGVSLKNAVYGVGTVQEEVGIRGATTSGHSVNPDVSIILEVNIAQDIPFSPQGSPEGLGSGVSIYVYDATLIPNHALKELFVSVAKQKKIPYHLSAVPFGGTDGGRVHLNASGVPTIVIGVPVRYIHSGAGIVLKKDFASSVDLVYEVVRRLDEKTVMRLSK
ncbi:MAG: hypothetical protein B6D63_05280 [Candidatus Latescibacteria bacterium 4484_7]|nr:MAG: hypothetical protein B6D63_05280 [Candidatus Latescibacteria bacterium 4484_7]